MRVSTKQSFSARSLAALEKEEVGSHPRSIRRTRVRRPALAAAQGEPKWGLHPSRATTYAKRCVAVLGDTRRLAGRTLRVHGKHCISVEAHRYSVFNLLGEVLGVIWPLGFLDSESQEPTGNDDLAAITGTLFHTRR